MTNGTLPRRTEPSGILASMASIGPIPGELCGRGAEWSCIALLMLVGAVVAGCGGSSSRHVALDARALVAQPRDVGGIRSVAGSWNQLGDEGVYPLADALQSKSAPQPDAAYLATCPKSNAVILAYAKARAAVHEHGPLPVPLKLRSAATKLMKSMGYGGGYKYPHNFEGNYVAEEYLPDALRGQRFYEPAESGEEAEIKARLEELRKKE